MPLNDTRGDSCFLPSRAVASVTPHLVRQMLIVNSAVTPSSESLWSCICPWEIVVAFVFFLHCLLFHILLPIFQVFHLNTCWDFLSHPGDVSLGWLKAIVPTQLRLLPWVCSHVSRITGLVLFADTFVTTENVSVVKRACNVNFPTNVVRLSVVWSPI